MDPGTTGQATGVRSGCPLDRWRRQRARRAVGVSRQLVPDPLGDQRRGFSEFGFVDYGTFEITAGLASIMQLRGHLVGRTRHFGNEGSVTFTLPRSILPLIATTRALTLPTPMAFWLDGDRVVTRTGSRRLCRAPGKPSRVHRSAPGRSTPRTPGRLGGYGKRPPFATTGPDCSWAGQHHTTTTVSAALAAQLSLPTDLIGRRVELSGTYSVHAFSPSWLFPPQ